MTTELKMLQRRDERSRNGLGLGPAIKRLRLGQHVFSGIQQGPTATGFRTSFPNSYHPFGNAEWFPEKESPYLQPGCVAMLFSARSAREMEAVRNDLGADTGEAPVIPVYRAMYFLNPRLKVDAHPNGLPKAFPAELNAWHPLGVVHSSSSRHVDVVVAESSTQIHDLWSTIRNSRRCHLFLLHVWSPVDQQFFIIPWTHHAPRPARSSFPVFAFQGWYIGMVDATKQTPREPNTTLKPLDVLNGGIASAKRFASSSRPITPQKIAVFLQIKRIRRLRPMHLIKLCNDIGIVAAAGGGAAAAVATTIAANPAGVAAAAAAGFPPGQIAAFLADTGARMHSQFSTDIRAATRQTLPLV